MRRHLLVLHVAHAEGLQGEYPLRTLLREPPPLPPALRAVLGVVREHVLDHLSPGPPSVPVPVPVFWGSRTNANERARALTHRDHLITRVPRPPHAQIPHVLLRALAPPRVGLQHADPGRESGGDDVADGGGEDGGDAGLADLLDGVQEGGDLGLAVQVREDLAECGAVAYG